VKRLQEFTVGPAELAEVRCPCLGMVGEGEGAEALGQYQTFLRYAAGPSTGRIFTAMEGADAHCQAPNQRLFAAELYDWLDGLWAG